MICLYIYMRQRYTSLSLRNILDLVSIINSHFVRYKELDIRIRNKHRWKTFNSIARIPRRDAADIYNRQRITNFVRQTVAAVDSIESMRVQRGRKFNSRFNLASPAIRGNPGFFTPDSKSGNRRVSWKVECGKKRSRPVRFSPGERVAGVTLPKWVRIPIVSLKTRLAARP